MDPVKTPESHALLPVQLRPTRPHDGAPLSARLVVHCPSLDAEIVVQRCQFCSSGDGVEKDPITGQLWQRCAYLHVNRDEGNTQAAE